MCHILLVCEFVVISHRGICISAIKIQREKKREREREREEKLWEKRMRKA